MATNSNPLADQLGDLLKETPKTVLAAIAVSAVIGKGANPERAQARIALEWVELYEQGIVTQRPSRTARLLAACERQRNE